MNLKRTRTGFELGKFEFICNWRSNRSGFVHEGELYYGDNYYPSTTAKCQYYNRTWEAWEYQTLCRDLFFQFLQNKDRKFIEENKDDILKISEDLGSNFGRIFQIMKTKEELMKKYK